MGYKESYMPEPLDEGKKKKKKEILHLRIINIIIIIT